MSLFDIFAVRATGCTGPRPWGDWLACKAKSLKPKSGGTAAGSSGSLSDPPAVLGVFSTIPKKSRLLPHGGGELDAYETGPKRLCGARVPQLEIFPPGPRRPNGIKARRPAESLKVFAFDFEHGKGVENGPKNSEIFYAPSTPFALIDVPARLRRPFTSCLYQTYQLDLVLGDSAPAGGLGDTKQGAALFEPSVAARTSVTQQGASTRPGDLLTLRTISICRSVEERSAWPSQKAREGLLAKGVSPLLVLVSCP